MCRTASRDQRIEGWREDVEDATAVELFREATGFTAGRVAPETLIESVDVSWLAALLRWNTTRTHRWLGSARASWRRALMKWHLERLLLEVEFAARDGRVPAAVMRPVA